MARSATVCGQVWFVMPGLNQVIFIQTYGDDLRVLACGCKSGENCQSETGKVTRLMDV